MAALFSILATLARVEARSPEMADVVLRALCAAGARLRDVRSFLPWNLSEERKNWEPGITEGIDSS